MSNWSRRRALQAAIAVGTLSLAGCSGSTSSSEEVSSDRGDPVSDVEVRFARDTRGNHLYDAKRGNEGEPDPEAGETLHLTSDDERDAVTFRPTDPATELRSFVDDTDLDSESVYLLEEPIDACHEARLLGVYRESDGVDAEFCRGLRPADVDCSDGDRDRVGVAIRLPFPGDEFTSIGSRWSSDCDRPGTAIAREGGDEE